MSAVYKALLVIVPLFQSMPSPMLASVGGGGGALWRGNEPAAMTTMMDRPFDTLNTVFPYDGDTSPYVGWRDNSSGSGVSIFTDATAPKTPSNVGRATFPTSLSEGNAPQASGWTPATAYRTIYFGFYYKLSSNWQGHTSTVNKMIFFYIAGSNRVYLNAWGSLAGEMNFGIGLQGMTQLGAGGGNLGQAGYPGNDGVMTRGQWHLCEGVMIGNTAGTADGSVEWWLDGVHLGLETGLQFAAGAGTWEDVQWSSTWGGFSGSDVVSQEMYMDMDHFYASGKIAA